MYCTVRVPDRRIRTNFEISNQKRSLTFEVNDPEPSLSGSIWLVLPPTRLTRLETKNLTYPIEQKLLQSGGNSYFVRKNIDTKVVCIFSQKICC